MSSPIRRMIDASREGRSAAQNVAQKWRKKGDISARCRNKLIVILQADAMPASGSGAFVD